MSTKILFKWLVIATVIGMVALFETAPVQAQCGNPPLSSCASCHAQVDPVNEKGEWHIIHASKDICINCHGGNGSVADKELAHEGLMAHPLDDIYTDCHSCHLDYDVRAARFAPTLGVTPSSCATPTPIPLVSNSGQPPFLNTSMPVVAPSPHPFLIIGTMLSILTLFLFGLGWLEKNHVS
jgi:hypothetical protein